MAFRRKGVVLSAVLASLLTILFLIMAVSAMGLTYVHSVNQIVGTGLAEDLGDSLVAKAIVELKKDGSFGKAAGANLNHNLGAYGDPQSVGNIVFGLEPGRSINNSDGGYTGKGYGDKPVPSGTVQLVVNLIVRGLHYRYVVLVTNDPWPHVISTDGTFTSNRPLLLGALKSLQALQDGFQREDLKEGSLLSNADVTINAPADVKGDLTAAGSIQVLGNLEGEKKEHADPEEVPHIEIHSYDPAGKPEIANYRPADRIGESPLAVAGLARYTGPLTLQEGLTLNNGVFYVDGDLVVEKGVKGYGALFVTGKLKVSGGSDLGADYMCALVSGGDLTIQGSGPNNTQFRGLVYSGGNIQVSDITIVGSLVGSSTSGSPKPMVVENANVAYDPKAVQLDLNLQFSGLSKVGNLGGATLRPGANLTPLSLWDTASQKFREPTTAELQQALLFHFPRNEPPPKTWDQLTEAERLDVSSPGRALVRAKTAIASQLEHWNEQKLTPETSDASFHLDLNRFLKLQTRMRILTRSLERV